MGKDNDQSSLFGNDSFLQSMADSAKTGTNIFLILTVLGLVFKLIFWILGLIARLLKAGWDRYVAKKRGEASPGEEEEISAEDAFASYSPADQLRIKLSYEACLRQQDAAK